MPQEVGTGKAQPAPETRRVLIVDDNEDCRYVLAAYLRLQGHEVRTAAEATEAMQIAAEFLPEVIFLDVCMPTMDGHELCARLREMQALARAVIYALSALDRANRASPSPSGFDGHYTKPVDLALLAAALSAGSVRAT
jgi:CheY-like chemotaxis protein